MKKKIVLPVAIIVFVLLFVGIISFNIFTQKSKAGDKLNNNLSLHPISAEEESKYLVAKQELSDMLIVDDISQFVADEKSYDVIRAQSEKLELIKDGISSDREVKDLETTLALRNKTDEIINLYVSYFKEHGWSRYGDDPALITPIYDNIENLKGDLEDDIRSFDSDMYNVQNDIWPVDTASGETKEEAIHTYRTKKELATEFLQKINSLKEPYDMKALSGEYCYLYLIP